MGGGRVEVARWFDWPALGMLTLVVSPVYQQHLGQLMERLRGAACRDF